LSHVLPHFVCLQTFFVTFSLHFMTWKITGVLL
jgi:hypothetical protein